MTVQNSVHGVIGCFGVPLSWGVSNFFEMFRLTYMFVICFGAFCFCASVFAIVEALTWKRGQIAVFRNVIFCVTQYRTCSLRCIYIRKTPCSTILSAISVLIWFHRIQCPPTPRVDCLYNFVVGLKSISVWSGFPKTGLLPPTFLSEGPLINRM